MDQPTPAPTRKVSAGALGGALAAIVAWFAGIGAGLDVPPGVEAAFATILSFAAGYLIRES